MRIYLDNAATSWPKPEVVYQSVDDYQRRIGAPAGRSGYAEATDVGRAVEAARAAAARLLGAGDPRQVVFTFNGTDSLNLALHGLVHEGDHVVTTAAEHNSVLRPLRLLEDRKRVAVTRVPCDGRGAVDPDAIRRALDRRARLVAITHASNVTGAIQPIAEIAAMAHRAGALVLVDAAQSAGHLPINVRALGIDVLATSGHKGLLGPLGTGLVYVRPGLEAELDSLRQGGTGTQSDQDRQPEQMPWKYESGNLNVPGIVGLGAGIRWVEDRGVESIMRHEAELTARFLAAIAGVQGVTVWGPRDAAGRLGVVSLTVDGYDPQELAATLDGVYKIQVRPGLHCAPLMHRALGTASGGGTVRLSFGSFTSTDEVDAAVAALKELANESRR